MRPTIDELIEYLNKAFTELPFVGEILAQHLDFAMLIVDKGVYLRIPTGIRMGQRVAEQWFLGAFHVRIDKCFESATQYAILARHPLTKQTCDASLVSYADDVMRTYKITAFLSLVHGYCFLRFF